MKSNIFFAFILLFFAAIAYADAPPTTNAYGSKSESTGEIAESRKCCYPNGISYCDATAGHYVCKDGGYSACICTTTAPVSTYRQLALGCCLWHGGVAASTFGQVVCQDGSLSEVCSIQSADNNSNGGFGSSQ